ncbi:hypothetical protein CHARACLAT_007536, partial [Characodon lateralis]|nr:hypothetical protein [Characodon lateralis]
MLLRFRTDSSVTHRGFKATYSIASCGGTYVGQSGEVQSPGFPGSNYPENSNCEWYLKGPTGHYLTLSYRNFSLQNSQGCAADYVEIREYNVSGRLLGRHCGNNIPASVDTSDSFAYVRFVSDTSGNAAGFSLYFEASVEACGGELNAPSGTITSPNYPNLYPHSRVCRWELVVTPNRRVTLTINDLRLEDSGTSCVFDYVDVFNGLGADAPRLQRFCATISPGTQVHSSGNTMAIVFHTDASVSSGGFMATYSSDEPAECGGILSDPAGGNFTSPGYQVSNYSSNLNCEWSIQNPLHINSSIVVLIEDMHLENHQTCELDYLVIRLGDSDGDLLGRFCGRTPPAVPIVVFTPELWVHFRTDSSQGDLGFKAKYSFSECGGWQTGEGGVLSSPNYPNMYPSPSRCAWLLEAPTGYTITPLLQAHLEESQGIPIPAEKHSPSSVSWVFLWDSSQWNVPRTPHQGGIQPDARATSTGSSQQMRSSGSTLSPSRMTELLTLSLKESPDTLRKKPAASGSRIVATTGTNNLATKAPVRSLGNEGAEHDPLGLNVPHHPRNVFEALPEVVVEAPPHGKLHQAFPADPQGLFGSARSDRHPAPPSEPAFHQVVVSGNSAALFTRVSKTWGRRTDDTTTKSIIKLQPRAKGGFPLVPESEPCVKVSPTISSRNLSTSHTGSNSFPRGDIPRPESQLLQPSIRPPRSPLSAATHTTMHPTPLAPPMGGEPIGGPTFPLQAVPGQAPLGEARPPGTRQRAPPPGLAPEWVPGDPHPGEGTLFPFMLLVTRSLSAALCLISHLSFSYFNLESHITCSWDSVTVFNGGSPGSPIIGQYCGTTFPGTIQSGSNKLAVVFLADHSVSKGGFIATWSTDSSGCGGVIHADMGTIKSTNYPQNFPANMECSWQIIAHEGNHLEMSFSDNFEIPDSTGSCQSSYIKVWSGSTQNADDLLVTGCGSLAPEPVVAPYNIITSRFQATATPGVGFSMSFSTRCGASVSGSKGRVVSPNFPADYPDYANCNYTIDAGQQTVIVLSFKVFQIEAHSACMYDGLKIYNPVTSSTPMATLCGTNIPGPFSTLGPMLLNFYSDSLITSTGFMAEYSTTPCGGFFNSTSGTVSSPALSITNYHHNMNCTYHISIQADRVVDLKFNTFSLEASSLCQYDHVAVYDGPDTLAPLLGKFCGTVLPPKLRSSTNNLFIIFRTDATVSSVGWRATYSQTLGPAQGCGGYLSMPIGMFGSPDPNLDGRYEPRMNCVWTIEMPVNKAINLTFSFFDLESSSTCRYDYVNVYDGDNMNFPLVGTYCGGSIPAYFLSSGNFLTIHFVTDSSVQKQGFNATYRAVPLLCGGILNATTAKQTLTSPSFPSAYPPYTSCRWVLDAPPRETIKVSVQTFVLNPSQSCSTNYLEMKDWPLGDYGQSHKFCTSDGHPPDFYSFSRTVLMYFKSDTFLPGNGLSFSYQIANCSRLYEQEYGYLRSPGWPDIYPHNMDCIIVLEAPQNSSISFFFNNFDVESHSNCGFDYVE